MKFHLKSSPVYSSISQAHQIKVKMKNTLKVLEKVCSSTPALLLLILSPCICFETRTDQFSSRKLTTCTEGQHLLLGFPEKPTRSHQRLLFYKYIHIPGCLHMQTHMCLLYSHFSILIASPHTSWQKISWIFQNKSDRPQNMNASKTKTAFKEFFSWGFTTIA